METRTYFLQVNILSIDEFSNHRPNYGPFTRGEYGPLFEMIMSPENFNKARVVTLELKLPAIAGIAEACYRFVVEHSNLEWNQSVKQYIGSVLCALMEANGFEKTGKKRAVPHHGFSKCELYQSA